MLVSSRVPTWFLSWSRPLGARVCPPRCGRVCGEWIAVLTVHKGDEKYLQKTYQSSHSAVSKNVCMSCRATSEAGDLLYTLHGPKAGHRHTLLTATDFYSWCLRSPDVGSSARLEPPNDRTWLAPCGWLNIDPWSVSKCSSWTSAWKRFWWWDHGWEIAQSSYHVYPSLSSTRCSHLGCKWLCSIQWPKNVPDFLLWCCVLDVKSTVCKEFRQQGASILHASKLHLLCCLFCPLMDSEIVLHVWHWGSTSFQWARRLNPHLPRNISMVPTLALM